MLRKRTQIHQPWMVCLGMMKPPSVMSTHVNRILCKHSTHMLVRRKRTGCIPK